MNLDKMKNQKLGTRVFGYIAHVKVSGFCKGYRLHDSESEKVCVSRDVVFEESKTGPWCQLDKDAGEVQVSAAQPLQQGV